MRRNTTHTHASLAVVAAQLRQQAVGIQHVADRWSHEHPKAVLSLAHQASVESGLIAAAKLRRDAESRLAALQDQQKFKQMSLQLQ
jgi:hypothetical protein